MGEKIILSFGCVRIPALLSDTAAARDFRRRLPLTVTGTRGEGCCCFPAAIGRFDPEETQIGWQNGDITLSGGRLKIFLSGEETSGHTTGVMVIAHVGEADLPLFRQLPQRARLRIEAAGQPAEKGKR